MSEVVKITVQVAYENDTVAEAPLSQWTRLRSDGVQQVTLCIGLYRVRFSAMSIYWLYPEGENYVVGCGSVRYDPNPLTEIVIAPDGTQTERHPEFMPDLKHSRVKLGWWKHG